MRSKAGISSAKNWARKPTLSRCSQARNVGRVRDRVLKSDRLWWTIRIPRQSDGGRIGLPCAIGAVSAPEGREKLAGEQAVNATDLPAPHGEIQRTAGAVQKMPALAERQLVNRVDGDPVSG